MPYPNNPPISNPPNEQLNTLSLKQLQELMAKVKEAIDADKKANVADSRSVKVG
jgi:hypothetical protein